MRPPGVALVFIAVAVPAYWFVQMADRNDPTAMFSHYLGVAALVLMGFSQLMATRIAGLETLFGGLDRIYVLHKWIGVTAMVTIVLHDTIDAEIDLIGGETVLTEIAETLGEISLYGFLVLATLSVATFIPYHLWRYTHKVIGGFYAASALHFALIAKPFALIDPVGLYVLFFCVFGVLCYFYTLAPFHLFQGRHVYKITDLRQAGDSLAVSLSPTGGGMKHRAGQFAFAKVMAPGLDEVHPFTISKAPDDARSLRFTIKRLGDFTGRLASGLNAETLVHVAGPYGHFHTGSGNGPEIWIAAGVGITPFLARAGSPFETARRVHLFYCVKCRDHAAHLDELEAIASNNPNFILHLIDSSKNGRLTAGHVVEAVEDPLRNSRVSFCGPKAMRKKLRKDLINAGLLPSNFVYEEFEIRSGLGLSRLARRLLGKLVTTA